MPSFDQLNCIKFVDNLKCCSDDKKWQLTIPSFSHFSGVGKSAVIKAMSFHAEKILRKSGDSPNHPRVLVCAPTGKAASLIGGITLHSCFDFKFGLEHRALSDKSLAKFRENFKHLKLLIIDEVSLLGSDMLYKIHLRLCEVLQVNIKNFFANISVVLVGDLLQLPPVNASYVFKKPRNSHFSSDVCSLWDSFEPVILQTNHRQGEGKTWAKLLNRFREGNITEDDKEVLKSRVTNDAHLEQDTMHIMYTNLEVSNHNEEMLKTIEAPLITIKAKLTGPRPLISKDGRVGSTQFMETLKIKIGARCVLTWNISTVDDLVNGSSGTIVGVEYKKLSKDKKVEAVIVSLDNKNAGQIQRQKYKRLSEKYKSVNGTPIFPHELECNIPRGKGSSSHEATGKIEQHPLRLFWASTAHKMQVSQN